MSEDLFFRGALLQAYVWLTHLCFMFEKSQYPSYPYVTHTVMLCPKVEAQNCMQPDDIPTHKDSSDDPKAEDLEQN